MTMSETLLPEFDLEMANTRKTLERVPENRFDWRPHEKSSTLGSLASHLANIPSWTSIALTQDSFDTAPVDAPPREPLTSRAEVLEAFDRNVRSGREAFVSASDERLMEPWTLLAAGRPLFAIPRIVVIRRFVLSHTVHHRAQLGVYLRLNDVPVPSIYGPSADEGMSVG